MQLPRKTLSLWLIRTRQIRKMWLLHMTNNLTQISSTWMKLKSWTLDFGGRVYGNSLFFPSLLFLGTITHIFYIFYLEQISNRFLYSTNDTARNISPAIRYECWHNRHGSGHDTSESSSTKGCGLNALYRTFSSIKQKLIRPPLSML
jgi:hypothetical protein